MIMSMTGFGKAVSEYNGKVITADIRSLNSKVTDLRIKVPNSYKDKEISIRNMVIEGVVRGKIDLTLSISSEGAEDEIGLNVPLFRKYFFELKKLQNELNFHEQGDLFAAILRIPNVVTNVESEISEKEWEKVVNVIAMAIQDMQKHRSMEGKALKKDLKINVENIAEKLQSISPFEDNRVERLRAKFRKNLDDFLGNDLIDFNRFEQEVLHYIEKLDINEEKVRLAQHCQYFLEILNNEDLVVGKKLSFISQEMGREINTLGAKAQDFDIQQIVVSMKDSLEQIKEQLANVV